MTPNELEVFLDFDLLFKKFEKMKNEGNLTVEFLDSTSRSCQRWIDTVKNSKEEALKEIVKQNVQKAFKDILKEYKADENGEEWEDDSYSRLESIIESYEVKVK